MQLFTGFRFWHLLPVKGAIKLRQMKGFNTFEYQYSGAYRTCIGEFSALAPAKEFQNTLRKSGYPQHLLLLLKIMSDLWTLPCLNEENSLQTLQCGPDIYIIKLT